MYEIDLYENAAGNSEIRDYLEKINGSRQRDDQKVLKKLIYQMQLLSRLGPNLTEPNAKRLKGYRYSIMELRPLPERVFYAAWGKESYVLLHHYTKRQNRTDIREVERALKNLDDWLARKARD
ncbi:type II toxin-antitoxin system RelE/ParE family toxin [Lactiplantibacillus nangangensis]|uniref:Type II toxin-antitoxin system RelE/ParE family toxin n=1 Tax=Lactiplantibacillus nangangensis TaxID=2559917 RepID=A0ABW1SK73_9LACO|nr:type II toxin-antitoxin system RelE/ParE family toxin [Lactiplantibacillus nangangensis]